MLTAMWYRQLDKKEGGATIAKSSKARAGPPQFKKARVDVSMPEDQTDRLWFNTENGGFLRFKRTNHIEWSRKWVGYVTKAFEEGEEDLKTMIQG
ncbi:hypothetical protein ACHAPG_009327 [Botrytis cinerea]